MNLRIGSVIQKLRKLKGLTQQRVLEFQRQLYQSGKVEVLIQILLYYHLLQDY